MKFKINNTVLDCELAITSAQKIKGLMYNENPPNMAFLYPRPDINKFWMKSTPCKLLIIFCLKGKVIDIQEGIPFSLKSVGPNSLTDLVIEVPFDKYFNQFKIGDSVVIKK